MILQFIIIPIKNQIKCKTTNIIKTSFIKIYLILSKYPVITKLVLLLIIFLTKNIINNQIYADDRTLYDIMNSPEPENSKRTIIHRDGSWVTYNVDGTVNFVSVPIEIHVKELNPTDPKDYQTQKDATAFIEAINKKKIETSNGEFIDPNDTNEQPVVEQYSIILQNCVTLEEIVTQSINYVKFVIPEDKWAQSANEIADPKSAINEYLTYLENISSLETNEKRIIFTHFQVAASTYNAALLFNLDIEQEENKKILQEVFSANLRKILLSQ